MSKIELKMHLNNGHMGYYKFDRTDVANVVVCIHHLGTVICHPRPSTRIFRFRIFNTHRFMMLFSEISVRSIFKRLSPLLKTVYVNNLDFGIVIADHHLGTLSSFGMVGCDSLSDALVLIERGPCHIVITHLCCNASMEREFLESVQTITSMKYGPKSVVVSYLKNTAHRPPCDAAYFQLIDADMNLRVLLCAYVLYYNRDVLKTSLNATSF